VQIDCTSDQKPALWSPVAHKKTELQKTRHCWTRRLNKTTREACVCARHRTIKRQRLLATLKQRSFLQPMIVSGSEVEVTRFHKKQIGIEAFERTYARGRGMLNRFLGICLIQFPVVLKGFLR